MSVRVAGTYREVAGVAIKDASYGGGGVAWSDVDGREGALQTV